MGTKKQQIIVTGINGFVGEHLAHHLQSLDFSVVGIGREPQPRDRVAAYLDGYHSADLLKKESLYALPLNNASGIIHLAGLASVAESFEKPDLYKTGNASMTDNLLSAAASQGFKGRVVAISTGALYSPDQPMPLNESAEITQSSPYVIGKLRAEEVVQQHRSRGMDIVIVRPFNHIGPGQGKGFLVGDLYEQLSQAASIGSSDISVGNLSTQRDYTDVRDIVKAYTSLLQAPILKHTLYNVASGKPYSGFDILNYLKAAMGLNSINAVVDQSRVRPTDAPMIIGDSHRIYDELGWKPVSSVEIAIRDFVEQRLSSSS